MVDTVTLARLEREKQGPWEVEVSYGGEGDLHKHHKTCAKNPGHSNFIPVDTFNIKNLPSGYQDNNLLDFVRAVSDLTVRVSANYVSEKRPETAPGSDKPYPFFSNRGSDMMRVGTGWVFIAEIKESRTCECKECLHSPSPKTQFGQIQIRTATHVVYDTIEGEYTTCHLFFDRGGTPDACSGVVTLSGMSDVAGASNIDYCIMTYLTHDLDLADQLNKMVTRCDSLYNILRKIYSPRTGIKRSPTQAGPVPAAYETLTIIVSHPHGCSKQVSLGDCTNSKERTSHTDNFTYTTATCPGSSGAFVFVLGNINDPWQMLNHAHSGNSEEDKKLNFSGLGHYYLPRSWEA